MTATWRESYGLSASSDSWDIAILRGFAGARSDDLQSEPHQKPRNLNRIFCVFSAFVLIPACCLRNSWIPHSRDTTLQGLTLARWRSGPAASRNYGVPKSARQAALRDVLPQISCLYHKSAFCL